MIEGARAFPPYKKNGTNVFGQDEQKLPLYLSSCATEDV